LHTAPEAQHAGADAEEVVTRYPILDPIGAPVLVCLFLVLLLVERRWPLRQRVDRWLRRIVINLAVAGPSFVVIRLLLIPVVVAVATWGDAHDVGLLRVLDLPSVVAAVFSVLLLDYTMYVWHWLNHRVSWLWRFHHVHHTDLDLDVSTAFRFHFGEMLLSVAARSVQVLVVGASPIAVLVYEIVLEASTEFHHSNLRLPVRLERVLSWFIMTPRAHGIHHSIVAEETNSNFSNFLILWDRLHRTLRLNIRQEQIVIGVPDYRDPRELGLVSLLLMPFRRQRRRTAADAPSRPGNPSSDQARLAP
jgi:sterol desaturase/sphingolipid hydroxylase (fatty acid hydroxylase superfamily)